MNINIICAYADHGKFRVNVIPDVHCPNGSTYLTSKEENMFDVNNRISEMERKIQRLEWLSSHRLKGIQYWIGRAK